MPRASVSAARTIMARRCGLSRRKIDNPRKLEWKGSHTALAIHPDGDAVVTAMQENALHGWRLSDDQHMRMSGYPAKTQSLSFTRNGKWLASSGADAMVLWPFFGGGPMGKAPIEFAGGDGIVCTRSRAIRCRRWWRAVLPTGCWCWRISTRRAFAGGAAGTGRDIRAGLEPERHAAGFRHRERFRGDHRPIEAINAAARGCDKHSDAAISTNVNRPRFIGQG